MTEPETKDPTLQAKRLEIIRAAKGVGAKPDVAPPPQAKEQAPSAPVAEPSKTEAAVEVRPRPEPKAAEGETEQHVPFSRFSQVNEQRKALEAERTRLQDELRSLQAETSKARREGLPDLISKETRPDAFEAWPVDKQQAWFAASAAERAVKEQLEALGISDVKQLLRVQRVQKEYSGNLSIEQAEALAEVSELAPRLSAAERLGIAKQRFPDLFGAEAGGQVPPSHRVQSPSSTGSAAVSQKPRDEKGRFAEEARAATNPGELMKARMRTMTNRRLAGTSPPRGNGR